MVIGFDASRAFTKEKTGTENYSYQLLLYLAKIDHKNQYILYLRPNNATIVATNVFPENFQFKIINWPRFWTQGGLALQTFTDNLDVLFVPSHTLPLFRKPGLKTVMTVHDLGAEYLPSMHQLKQKLYLDFITRFQLKSATKLIAVSKATEADLVKKINIPANNIEVIYEGIDNQLFRPLKGEILVDSLNKFDLKQGEYFLFVGTVQPRKNLCRLIEAFGKSDLLSHSEFSDIKLVFVGSKGWLSDEIYALPKKLGIEDRVKFLGHVDNADLPALYCGAAALVYPSLFEGFGLPILEAFACGCPVLTSNISSMPEVAGDAALLVNPVSVEEITDGMIELVSDRDLRERLIKQGFVQAKKFSWEKCAKETLRVLENLKF
ncbi:glycosyltransferase family 4 protein [Candidatus Daviesbacteria bacterium]|nr:glycosyltransferase family 4 protein [Candidatus Daviesbacteria bacterium]